MQVTGPLLARVKGLSAARSREGAQHEVARGGDRPRVRGDVVQQRGTAASAHSRLCCARLNAMRAFLSRFDYDGKDAVIVGEPDPKIVQRGIDAIGD